MLTSVTLNVIDKPAPLSRAVIHAQTNDVPPFLVGKGDTNYLCGSCGEVIAQRVWKGSIRYVVVECPKCKTYNEFPMGAHLKSYNRVLLLKGNYNFSGPVIIELGKYIEGQ